MFQSERVHFRYTVASREYRIFSGERDDFSYKYIIMNYMQKYELNYMQII